MGQCSLIVLRHANTTTLDSIVNMMRALALKVSQLRIVGFVSMMGDCATLNKQKRKGDCSAGWLAAWLVDRSRSIKVDNSSWT